MIVQFSTTPPTVMILREARPPGLGSCPAWIGEVDGCIRTIVLYGGSVLFASTLGGGRSVVRAAGAGQDEVAQAVRIVT